MNTRNENPVSPDTVRKLRIEPLTVEITTDSMIQLWLALVNAVRDGYN